MILKNHHIIITLASLLFLGCSQRPAGVDARVLDAAGQGDAVAQMKVGLAFDQEQAFEEAVLWYRKAAEQGLSEAQNNLGVMYKDGQGVVQDYAEAARWFQMAAEQGNTLSQSNLGWLYHAGKGVPRDTTLALYWYQQAAAKGHVTAQNNLGILLLQSGDTAAAIPWLQQAAAQGHDGSQRILDAIKRN